MKTLTLTLTSPEYNLACDEVLLDQCEEGGDECLRFWESDRPFVVLGYANRIHQEVNFHSCRVLGIPILRRRSGGGTVLQQPGCLNFALVLRIHEDGPTRSIVSTNVHVMETQACAVRSLLGVGVKVQGFTDLTLDGRKFSGNAQRRKRKALLFHGTFLFKADLSLISQVLPPPSKQPAYRKDRPHEEFLKNLPLEADRLREAVCKAWLANEPAPMPPMDRLDALVRNTYGDEAWTRKF